MLFFVLYSILFISSSCSSSILIVYSTTTGRAGGVRAGQDVTGPARARTAMRDSSEGQDRGAGGQEEEGDGWAGVLGGGGGEREEQGTGWPDERSGELYGWPAVVCRTRRTRE